MTTAPTRRLAALLGLTLTILPAVPPRVSAAEPKQPPRTFDVLLGKTKRLTTSLKADVRSVTFEDAGYASARREADQPTVVEIRGLKVGSTRATVTDASGATETVEVVVWTESLTVPVGSTVVLQTPSRRPIRMVVVENDSVIRVRPVETEPNMVVITGLRLGRSKLTVVDVDGRTDEYRQETPVR